MEISAFENFNKIKFHTTVEKVLHEIQHGTYHLAIMNLRNLYAAGKKKEYSEHKKRLLSFTPSGKFNEGRKKELLIEYSGMIILDLDQLGDKLSSLKEKINTCPFTFSCFASPSNDGLKVLVKVDTDSESHLNAFNQVKDYYEDLLHVEIDKSGKDVTRLCFMSYDPDLYINTDSKVFNVSTKNRQSERKSAKINNSFSIEDQVSLLIGKITESRTDITSNYEDWCNIGFALENEFGEQGRTYFHKISRLSPNYKYDDCNKQYNKCMQSKSSGITIKTLFHIAKDNGIELSGIGTQKSIGANKSNEELASTLNTKSEQTTNKFTITEEYLNERYIIRQNVVSNKFEYKEKGADEFKELNENNLFIKLQKDNINISLSNVIALLKSDFVPEYNPFVDYFESLPAWDLKTDYINQLSGYLHSPDRERLDRHFKKWLVRLVRTAIDKNYYNKQAFVLVSNKQNSGKSTFCRFLCPNALKEYIAENIGTDKDSQIALTENLLLNLDELSTADKNGINAWKSLFSKPSVKVRLVYDKRASTHPRRASFLGSTDRWEFLTDENGSVRWLCFEITSIDWDYSKEIDMDKVYAQAYHLLKKTSFNYELTSEEIDENDRQNRKYQVSTPERDLIQKYLKPAEEVGGEFVNSTEIIFYLNQYTTLKLSPPTIGKEMKFLGFKRASKRCEGMPLYGYYVKKISNCDVF